MRSVASLPAAIQIARPGFVGGNLSRELPFFDERRHRAAVLTAEAARDDERPIAGQMVEPQLTMALSIQAFGNP